MRVLDRVPCICYLVQFLKDKGKDVLALLDSGSKVNAMTSAYTAQLSLKIQKIDIGTQKIDKFSLEIYSMVIAIFQVLNKLGRLRFFQETFLLANISIKVVPGMLFLIFTHVDIQFTQKKLIWKTYTTEKALPTTCRVELIDQKRFAKAALDENIKAFMIHIAF